MKPFQIPISSIHGVAMSLLGLCLLSGLDTPVAYADFKFGTPANVHLSGYAEGYIVCGPCISADGLEFYFQREEPMGEIYVARRPTPESTWGEPVKLGPPINTSDYEGGACISADGLSLYFSRASGGIFVTRRATTNDDWGTPVNLGPVVNNGITFAPSISPDELDLYFYSDRPGGFGDMDLYVTTRPGVNDAWGTPVNLGPTVNSAYREHFPCISSDGLALFFDSTRPGGEGGFDLYMSRRATKEDAWGMPVNLGPVISAGTAITPHISRDGSMLYFSRYGLGLGIWQAPIIPFVDFNGDGQIDAKDIVCMVSHWGTDDQVCDIGPMPWGDGFVDAQDLIVLSEHLFEDVNDPTLIAHWPLDETEGDYAHDGAGTIDATILGSPLWQPTGGQVDGAIQLDGLDDCIIAALVLDPAKGPFSVLVWVKGGAPGQVVISEPGPANWLMANAEGKLITDLKSSGRDAAALLSQAVITDGQWHRIALVWDGSRRSLYVDGVVAAEDTQEGLPSTGNGLYIGTGKGMEPGSFWSGMIDDVRIYNRVVRP